LELALVTVSDPLATASDAERLHWADAARGFGVTLVVVGHVWRGLEKSGIIAYETLFSIIDRVIYSVHMPLLFFISGLFFCRSLARHTTLEFITSRLTRLIWPLIAWTWLFFLFKAMVGTLANDPVPLSQFPIVPFPPRGEFWFLWSLFLVQIILMAAILPWMSRPTQVMSLMMAGLLSLLVYFEHPFSGDAAPWLFGAIAYAPFFIAGCLLADIGAYRITKPTVAAALAALGAAVLASLWLPGTDLSRILLGMIATLGIVVLFVAAADRSQDAPLLRFLGFLGMASMAIFVAHVELTAGTRIGLLKLGVHNLTMHLIAGCIAGVGGPLMLYMIAKRWRLMRVLGF
jgi:fucose 4-O-acetylase-like acetyltransferase